MKSKLFFGIALAVVVSMMIVSVAFAVDWNPNERWPSVVRTFQPNKTNEPIYDTTIRSWYVPIKETKWAADSRVETIKQIEALSGK